MSYFGGKSGAGVFQTLINLMPPHEVYIEPFLGGGAVMRLKRPAPLNLGIELDPGAIAAFVAAAQGTPGRCELAPPEKTRGSKNGDARSVSAALGEGRPARIAKVGGTTRLREDGQQRQKRRYFRTHPRQ